MNFDTSWTLLLNSSIIQMRGGGGGGDQYYYNNLLLLLPIEIIRSAGSSGSLQHLALGALYFMRPGFIHPTLR